MRSIKKKSGFTLVECIVAMAVLAIMSLLLTMILSITLKTRNSNITIEKKIDEQVDNLVAGTGASTEANDAAIEFFDKDGNSVGAIPANDSKGVSAKKKFYSDDDVEIGAFEYDFDKFEDFEKLESGEGGDSSKPVPGRGSKVYGKADIDGNVTITHIGDYKNPTANADGTYHVEWKITFTTKSGEPQKAVKLVLPTGTMNLDYNRDFSKTHGARITVLADDLIRMQPAIQTEVTDWSGTHVNSTETYTVTNNTEVHLSFDMSKEDYEKYYKSPQFYYYGGDGSSASVVLNSK